MKDLTPVEKGEAEFRVEKDLVERMKALEERVKALEAKQKV